MRFYWPIAKLDHEQRMVWGYASTEAEDEQGEVIRRDALAAALADYMRFANIREMHQPSAVGIAEEAAVDDKGLYLGARIVDGDAWAKVAAGVYKGFSIGGHVTSRDPADRNVITGLALTEISVVDRPANPEAVFDCWKRAPAEAPETVGRTMSAEPAGPSSMPSRKQIPSPPLRGEREGPTPQAWEGEVGASGRAGAPGRLRALLAELCDALASLASDHGDTLAALALADTLRKSRPGETDLGARLSKFADDILPRLDALQRRVEDIAQTPLPPLTAARGLSAIAKRDDGAGMFVAPDDIVAALARMTDEERTLALIKAARITPLR
jgi:HK97 family phage prohead protease